jgi:hypothetical protein
MNRLLAVLLRAQLALTRRWRDERDECGDVPGWVLVTVMTAGLVMAIWGVADDQLSQMLKDALEKVKN